MKRITFAAFAALCLTLPTLAQDPPPARRGGGPPADRRMFREEGRGRRGPRMSFGELAALLNTELKLTSQQKTEVDTLAQDYASRQDPQRREEMRALMEEYRAAAERGDETKREELRERMREYQQQSMDPFSAFINDVETLLTDPQKQVLAERRDSIMDRVRPSTSGRLSVMAERLAEQLELTEQQQTQFDQIVEEIRQKQIDERDRLGGVAPLMEEMRAAREAGDTAKVDALREQIMALRADPGQLIQELHTRLMPILTEQQKARLAELEQRPGGPGAETERKDVRTLFRAVKRLNLTEEQKKEIDELEQTASRSARGARGEGAEAQSKLYDDTLNQINELLSKEQQKTFADALSRRRPPRGERPAPPEPSERRSQPDKP